jgi:hypothetical protein
MPTTLAFPDYDFPDFTKIDRNFPFPDFKNGKRVHNQFGEIFLMIDSTVRKIPNADTYNKLFRDWSHIAFMIDGLYGNGPAIPDDASLKGNGGSVYLVMGGERRRVVDVLAMDLFSLNWVALTPMSDDEMKNLRPGPPVQIDFPGDGIPVYARGRSATDSQTYMSLDGKLRLMKFEMVDQIYRRRDGMLSIDSLAEQQSFGDPMPPNTALRMSHGKIYLRVGTERRWIVSPQIFEERQFDGSRVQDFEANDSTVPGKNIENFKRW